MNEHDRSLRATELLSIQSLTLIAITWCKFSSKWLEYHSNKNVVFPRPWPFLKVVAHIYLKYVKQMEMILIITHFISHIIKIAHSECLLLFVNFSVLILFWLFALYATSWKGDEETALMYHNIRNFRYVGHAMPCHAMLLPLKFLRLDGMFW